MAEVVDKDHGWDEILAAALAAELGVTAGILESATPYPDGSSPALVGTVQEFGLGVPERPWLAPSIDAAAPELVAITESEFVDPLLRGHLDTRRAAEAIGEAMVAAARRGLVSQGLVDTGHLIESVSYTIASAKP